MPEELRGQVEGYAFGCDLCQEVCPLNDAPVAANERFAAAAGRPPLGASSSPR